MASTLIVFNFQIIYTCNILLLFFRQNNNNITVFFLFWLIYFFVAIVAAMIKIFQSHENAAYDIAYQCKRKRERGNNKLRLIIISVQFVGTIGYIIINKNIYFIFHSRPAIKLRIHFIINVQESTNLPTRWQNEMKITERGVEQCVTKSVA